MTEQSEQSEQSERSSAPLLTPALRTVLAVIGGGSFGTGILAVFTTQNGTGTGVLLAFGGLLLVFALLGNRIESFEIGGASLRLRAAAADRYALADASERDGDPRRAHALREEARTLLRAAGPIAEDYQSVRRSMRAGPARVAAMEGVLGRARSLAAEESFSAQEVRRWLYDGSDGERVTALAMMRAVPELRDFGGILGAVVRPHSPFEQYHALDAVLDMVDDLDATQLNRLTTVIETERERPVSVLRRGSDRMDLANEILHRARDRARTLRTETSLPDPDPGPDPDQSPA